jgi:alkylated DNA nucleotide flippase Atl1
MKTSWKEKLETSGKKHGLPKIVKLNKKQEKVWGKGRMVIADPKEVDAVMKKVPKGKVTTINNIRERLAKKHGVEHCCPITAGIFARIAAGAADEDEKAGKKRITPYWRTLRGKDELNPKYPGGELGQKKLLEAEGVKVVKKGTKYRVQDLEKVLWK